MKKILIISIFILSITGYAQNKNFVIENNLIVWKFIYEDSTNISELKNNPRLEFKTDSTGYIKKTNFEDKDLRKFVAEFKIESKKNKYRVSAYNFIFDVEAVLLETIKGMEPTYTIESTFLKKDGTIRKALAFGYNLTETLNPHLVKLFTIEKNVKSDW
jgi:hypothetical protein